MEATVLSVNERSHVESVPRRPSCFVRVVSRLTLRNGRPVMGLRRDTVRFGAQIAFVLSTCLTSVLLIGWAKNQQAVSDAFGSRLPNSLDLVDTWASRATVLSENVSNASVAVLDAVDVVDTELGELNTRFSDSLAVITSDASAFGP